MKIEEIQPAAKPIIIKIELTPEERKVITTLTGMNMSIPDLYFDHVGNFNTLNDRQIIKQFLNGLREVLS